jgi:hypothetical protein
VPALALLDSSTRTEQASTVDVGNRAAGDSPSQMSRVFYLAEVILGSPQLDMQVLQKRQRLLCDCSVIEHGTRIEWRIARTGDQGEDGASEARKSPMAALANCHVSTGLEARTHHLPSLHCIYCRFGTLQHTALAPATSPH